jgi:hypothetical protein
VIINCISIYAIFPEELMHYVIFSILSVNYPLFNCVSKTLLKGIFFRGTIKKMGYRLFGGLKNIEVLFQNELLCGNNTLV